MVWHRLYLEAALPPGTGLRVWLAAADTRAALDDLPDDAFHPHDFGRLPTLPGDVARGVWLDQASELPFHAASWTARGRAIAPACSPA